jgi:hypothetical protein
MSFDENDLDTYLATLQDTYGGIAQTQDEEEREQDTFTRTNVENAIAEYSKNAAIYGAATTREEQQDLKIASAVSDVKVRVSAEAVASMFKGRYREMYHLLNPKICIYAYAKLNDDQLRKKSWREFQEQLSLDKEQIMDVIRYIRKYTAG